jgi:hypothetical protein
MIESEVQESVILTGAMYSYDDLVQSGIDDDTCSPGHPTEVDFQ